MASDLAIGDDSDLLLGDDDEMEGDDDFDLGDDLLLGDDEEELVLGGPKRGRRGRGRRKPKPLRYYQPREQTQVLPFPAAEGGGASVPAGATHTVDTKPQRTFQTQRFVWASTTSPFFRILQLNVGAEPMFVKAGVVPAEIFSQTGVGVALRGYIARPGIEITLQCQNADAAPHPIEASIIGGTLIG